MADEGAFPTDTVLGAFPQAPFLGAFGDRSDQ